MGRLCGRLGISVEGFLQSRGGQGQGPPLFGSQGSQVGAVQAGQADVEVSAGEEQKEGDRDSDLLEAHYTADNAGGQIEAEKQFNIRQESGFAATGRGFETSPTVVGCIGQAEFRGGDELALFPPETFQHGFEVVEGYADADGHQDGK